MKASAFLFLLCIGLFLSARPAAADSAHCTAITSLPATLSSAGVYCLTQDLTLAGTSGAAVTIAANSVTLDLNGHALRSNAAANVTTRGVKVVGQKYFSIIDGSIAGFAEAVYIAADGGNQPRGGLIADLKVQRSYYYGLLVICDGCIVRDNMITDTKTPASFATYEPQALAVEGTGDRVTGNRVFNTYPQSGHSGYAIAVGAANSTIADNYAGNDQLGADPVYGFLISGASDLLTGNQAQGLPFCYWLQGVNMKYRDNLSGGCTDAFDGGTSGGSHDLGGNN
jgi:hypothetical protein